MTNVIELSGLLHKFPNPGKDYEFASSLISQWRRKGSLSAAQLYWVDKLIEKAKAPVLPLESVATAESFSKIVALLEKTGLKRPKVYLQTSKDGPHIRLTVAGPGSRFQGTISVAHKHADIWYGRINKDGTFWANPRIFSAGSIEQVKVMLKAFAEDPEGVAAKYGQEQKCCCFCGLTLTDERSKEVGYGPDCARNYNLKWGTFDPTAEATPGQPHKAAKAPRAKREVEPDFAIW